MVTYCGLDCGKCEWKANCKGCIETEGRPLGGKICPLAECCIQNGHPTCADCEGVCALKNRLIDEFNALQIEGMPKVEQLYALGGTIVNMAYPLPGGGTAKFWDDSAIYLGAQLEKTGSERCFGLAADARYLLVCEYGANGADPEIVLFKRRKA